MAALLISAMLSGDAPSACEDTEVLSRMCSSMYSAAHVFFSGVLPPQLLAEIRNTPGLVQRLATLREVHLEFGVIDRRTFVCASSSCTSVCMLWSP